MATTARSGSLVGCQYAQAWLVSSDGYMMGTAGEGAAADTTTHARLLKFPVSAQVPNPTRVVTALKGGNRFIGQVQFGIDQIGNFPFVVENIDADFMAMAGGSAVDVTTNSRWTRVSDNKNNTFAPQMGLMFSTLFQSRDDGSDGAPLWVNYIIPRCQVDVNFPQMAYQAEGVMTCQVAPTMADKEPTGKTLTAMNVKDGKVVMYAIISPKPLALTTYVGDATETTFVLGYKPSSNIITLNAAAVEFARNGTLQALSSANTSTAVATMAAAGAALNINTALYETDFLAVA